MFELKRIIEKWEKVELAESVDTSRCSVDAWNTMGELMAQLYYENRLLFFFISQIINIIITRSKRTISVWMCLFRIHISYRYDFFELIDYTWNVICVIVCVCFFLIQYNICNVSVFRTRYGLVLVFFFIPSICSTHCISFKIKHYNAYNQNAQMEWLKMQCAKATYRIFIKKIKDEKCEDLSTE